jgi:hypothetical protein
MHTNQTLERTEGYFTAEWHESRSPWTRPAAPFITISRECCSGGSRLAGLLADKFNAGQSGQGEWGLYGGNIVNQMLLTNHLPVGLARFLPEDKVPEVNATIGEMVGLHPSLWDLVQKSNATMRRLASGGRVILVGRGANLATAGIAGGIHVRLVAPPAHRARYYAQRFGVSEADALAHNAAIEDPAAYDLVINTAQVPLEEAVDMVAAHVQAHARAVA